MTCEKHKETAETTYSHPNRAANRFEYQGEVQQLKPGSITTRQAPLERGYIQTRT